MPVQVSADEWTNYLSIKKKEKGKKKFGYFLNYLEQASRVPLCPSCRPVLDHTAWESLARRT